MEKDIDEEIEERVKNIVIILDRFNMITSVNGMRAFIVEIDTNDYLVYKFIAKELVQKLSFEIEKNKEVKNEKSN